MAKRTVNAAVDRKVAEERFEGKPAFMNGTEIRELTLKTPLNIKPSFWEHCSPLRPPSPRTMVKSQRAAPIKSRSGFDARSSSEHLWTDASVQSQHSCSNPPQSGGTSE